jgi:hypothetical protein
MYSYHQFFFNASNFFIKNYCKKGIGNYQAVEKLIKHV